MNLIVVESANEPILTRLISPEALALNQKVAEKGAGKKFRKKVQEKKELRWCNGWGNRWGNYHYGTAKRNYSKDSSEKYDQPSKNISIP